MSNRAIIIKFANVNGTFLSLFIIEKMKSRLKKMIKVSLFMLISLIQIEKFIPHFLFGPLTKKGILQIVLFLPEGIS
jgi:hypothetical protein